MDQQSSLPMVELHYPLRGSVSPSSVQLLNVDEVAFGIRNNRHLRMSNLSKKASARISWLVAHGAFFVFVE